MSKLLKLLQANKLLCSILALALVVRLVGILHGFPFIFNVDEPALMRSAYNIRFQINPGHFDWPHFHFYLNFLLYGVVYVVRGFFQIIGLRGLIEQWFPLLWKDPLIFYFVSRVFDALLGAFTIVPVYLSGKTLFNKRVGLMAALTLALLPHHVWHSHFALIDVPMTFWFSWSLYFSALTIREPRLKYIVLSSAFAGLSASTKYNGALAVGVALLALAIAYFWPLSNPIPKRNFTDFIKKGFIVPVVAALFFFLGTPFALLDFDTFTISDSPKGALWQFENVGKVDSSDYFTQLKSVLTTKFADDFGYSILFGFELAVVFFLFQKKTKSNLLVFLPGVLYFLYVTSFDKNRIHYYMLVYPFMCIAVGYLFVSLHEKLKLSLVRSKFVLVLAVLGFLVLPLVQVGKNLVQLTNKDTRVLAYEELNKFDPGATVSFIGNDLVPVMEKVPFKAKKVSSVLAIFSKSGKPQFFVLAANGSAENTENFNDLANNYTLKSAFYRSEYRAGPNIYVYELKETK